VSGKLPIRWLEDQIPRSQLSERARLGVEFAKALELGADRDEYAEAHGVSVATLYRYRKQAIMELALTAYGRGRGLRPPAVDAVRPPRYCAHCGEELPAASTSRRLYCGGRCRMAALRARRRGLSKKRFQKSVARRY
jgi:hypothetical protein